MAYSPAGDLIQSVGDAAGAMRRASESEQELREAERLHAAVSNLSDDCAANLAEKYALRAALAKLQPNHPLLTNQELRTRIQDAGVRAVALTKDFDAAREAGQTFRY